MEWLATGIIVFVCIGDILITRYYSKSMKQYSKEMIESNKVITVTIDQIVTNLKPKTIAKTLNDMYNCSVPNKE